MRHKWLVTGAGGFLGANAMRVLAGQGNTDAFGVTRMDFDLTDRESLRSYLRAHAPTRVLNTAAMASHPACELEPQRAMTINADVVKMLAQECTDIGATLIHISTDAVFDGHRGNYTESDQPNPNTAYGDSKLKGEIYALEHNDALVVRTNFFGWSPTGQRSILEFFVTNLSAGRSVNGFTDTITTSLYTSDLMERVISLSEARGIVHLTSSDPISKYAFGCLVAENFGHPPELIVATESPGGSKNISLNTDKARGLLGAPLPTQREGIVRATQAREIIQFRGQK